MRELGAINYPIATDWTAFLLYHHAVLVNSPCRWNEVNHRLLD